MKILLYPIGACFMLTNVSASDVFYTDIAEPIEKSKYELNVCNLDVSSHDRIMPGVTLSIHDVSSGNTSIEFTYARSISKTESKNVLTHDMPLESAFYAQFSYKF